jgi:hypothetical protein
MLPLPTPVRGGSIEALASFINLPTRSDFVLVVAWLLAALRHGGPYPLLAVSGEQGSAKTVLSKILRALIDPNAAPVRTAPREERDLFIGAGNGHLLAFDNLSDLPAWGSDALCRLASGGSFAVRRLYTDQDEVLFQAARPIVLNGIEDVITRPDLADRRTSSGRCWVLQAMDCVPYLRFDWNSCLGWRTLLSGRRRAKRHFPPLAGFFCMPIRQTGGLLSRRWSRPTQ